MSCNCLKACPIPYCIDELQVGIVEPGLTGLILQVTDIVTGRVRKIDDLSPQPDGLLIVDTTSIIGFWSSNLVYEIKLLYSDESGCELVPITIGDEVVTCINIETVYGMATRGILTIEGDSIEYLTFSHLRSARNTVVSFTPTFANNTFTVNYGEPGSSSNVMVAKSGITNNHSYDVPLEAITFTAKLRGDFTNMSEFSAPSNQLETLVLPLTNALLSVVVNGNIIDVDSISNALINLDKQGLSSGSFVSNNQTPSAAPNALGAIAKANLIAKGWTVTTD